MDKLKLKDIILKTLEKEGGAAGLKALAKAAKTSKGKLKKDLNKISGVKQHKHGDYISTPINEAETYTGTYSGMIIFCNNCPCGCSDVQTDYQPAGGGNATYAVCKDPCPPRPADTTSGAAKIIDPNIIRREIEKQRRAAQAPHSMDRTNPRRIKQLRDKYFDYLDNIDVEDQTMPFPWGLFIPKGLIYYPSEEAQISASMAEVQQVKNKVEESPYRYELNEQTFLDDFFIPVPSVVSVGLNMVAYAQQNPGMFQFMASYGTTGLGGEPIEEHTCCYHVKSTQEGFNQVISDYPNLEYYLSAQECEANWDPVIGNYFDTTPGVYDTYQGVISSPKACVRRGKINPNTVVGLDPDKFNYEKKPSLPPKPISTDKGQPLNPTNTHTLSTPQRGKGERPMRLREVKEILEVMLDEKKKKKKDRCHRKADQVYGTKTSAYKSGAIVKCRKGMIWKVGSKKKKKK